MTVLREIIAHFGVTADDQALKRLETTIDRVKGAFATLGVALGASQLVSFIHNAAEAADDLGDTAERLNISSQALQEWGYAAKLSGSSAEEFQGSISHLVRTLGEAASGGEEQQKTLKKLGVAYKDASGHLRRVDELLPEIADGIANVKNPTEQAAIAMKVFGRGAQPLVPLLARGSAGIAELREEFKSLGGGLSDEAVKKSSEYADQLDRLNVVTTSLKSQALNVLLPLFTRVSEGLTKLGQGFAWVTEKTYLLESAMLVIGARVVWLAGRWVLANRAILLSQIKTWAPIVAQYALVAAGVAVIVLAVEDLIQLFTGGKSVVGEFINSIFGIGAAEEAVISIKQGWDLLVYSIQKAIYEAKKFAGLDVGAEPESPEQAQERRRNEAVARGDVNAFAREHSAGRTREQSAEDFKEHRKRYVAAHPEQATAEDVAAGFAKEVTAGKIVSAPKEVSKGKSGKGGATVNNSSQVVVNLPPGTDREQVERIRKVVKDEQDKQSRRTMAGFAEEG